MSQQNTVFWLVLVWFNSEAISPRWGSPRLVSPWSLRDAWPPGARSWGPPPPLRCHYGTFLEKMKINRLNNLTGEVRMVSNRSALWQLFKFTEISTVILFNLPATKVNTRQLMVQHPLCDLFHPFKYSSLQPHANCSRSCSLLFPVILDMSLWWFYFLCSPSVMTVCSALIGFTLLSWTLHYEMRSTYPQYFSFIWIHLL